VGAAGEGGLKGPKDPDIPLRAFARCCTECHWRLSPSRHCCPIQARFCALELANPGRHPMRPFGVLELAAKPVQFPSPGCTIITNPSPP
jgi:hypothetical protein